MANGDVAEPVDCAVVVKDVVGRDEIVEELVDEQSVCNNVD